MVCNIGHACKHLVDKWPHLPTLVIKDEWVSVVNILIGTYNDYVDDTALALFTSNFLQGSFDLTICLNHAEWAEN